MREYISGSASQVRSGFSMNGPVDETGVAGRSAAAQFSTLTLLQAIRKGHDHGIPKGPNKAIVRPEPVHEFRRSGGLPL
jgi:hypothetical protein